MRKLFAMFLVAALTLSLAACGSDSSTDESSSVSETSVSESEETSEVSESEETAEADGEGLSIAFFMFENSNTFTTYIRLGLENYGAEYNVTVESFDGRSDQSTQTDAIAAALATGNYDLIVVNPVDSGAGSTINAMCEEYGIPVIYADRAPDLVGGVLDEYEYAYYVGLDWSEPGAVQAEMMYEDWLENMDEIDRNGDGVLQYVILQGNVAQQNAIYRTEAIETLMAEWNEDGTMPNEQLDIQDGNWTSEQGRNIMDTWNIKYGEEIEAVLCNNDTMAMGAIESLKTAGAFDGDYAPRVYGINAIPDVWDLIEEGTMTGTVLTSPYTEAQIIIDMALNICAGNDPLEGTDYEWGEFGKDVRVANIAIRVDDLDLAKEDYNNCM